MRIRREGCLIIGGMRAARGGAAFARAPLVMECQGERYIVRGIGQAEWIEGEPMSDQEWRGVLASGEALELSKSQPATPSAALWLLRQNFFFRAEAMDTLRAAAVLHEEEQEGTLIVLVDESMAGGLPSAWVGRAFNHAWELASKQSLRDAVEPAELAMDLAPGFVEEHVALLSLIYERLGDKERAEGYLHLARNSCGDAFYERACEKKARFAGELASTSMVSLLSRPRFGPKMAPRRDRTVNRSFGRFDERDAA